MVRCCLLALVAAACSSSSTAAPEDAAAPDATDERVPDPCPPTSACPAAPATLARGAGLVAADRCAFPLAPDVATYDALIDALPPALARVTIADVVVDANRTAETVTAAQVPGTAPGIGAAFRWQAGDQSVTYWTPQGITGSFDATASGTIDGRRILLVSWYYTIENDTGSTVEKGVRIAVADITDPAAVRYRFALLVEPSGTADAPSWRAVPIHAGGLAWVGDRLYVPVTGSGFRVFDLSRILRVDSTDDRIGRDPVSGTYAAYSYAYAIPQIELVTDTSACAPVFSFVAYDHSSHALVTGEYSATSIAGRLYRWPLAASNRLQLTTSDRVIPDAAYFMGESHVQGALARDATWWLSSSRPAGGAGELVRTREGTASVRLGWSDSPEDLAFDPQRASIWSLTEDLDARYVFDVALTAVSP